MNASTLPGHVRTLPTATVPSSNQRWQNAAPPIRSMVSDRIQNVEDYYAAADLGVVTSDSESFCLSILEAMFYECPTVSTRVGGIPEVIRSDATGLLVAPGDAEALSSGIWQLISDPERRRAMGGAAMRFAEDHFTAEMIGSVYERLYYRQIGTSFVGKV